VTATIGTSRSAADRTVQKSRPPRSVVRVFWRVRELPNPASQSIRQRDQTATNQEQASGLRHLALNLRIHDSYQTRQRAPAVPTGTCSGACGPATTSRAACCACSQAGSTSAVREGERLHDAGGTCARFARAHCPDRDSGSFGTRHSGIRSVSIGRTRRTNLRARVARDCAGAPMGSPTHTFSTPASSPSPLNIYIYIYKDAQEKNEPGAHTQLGS
jgi:hypothetical protein